MAYDLYSTFDMEQHKNTYKNYMEAVIYPDGHVEYAVPSHQENLIKIACRQRNITRDELEDMCPESMYCDYLTWLMQITGCITVWSDGFLAEMMTEEQRKTLELLIENGLTKEGRA